jgi:hypothetical protein
MAAAAVKPFLELPAEPVILKKCVASIFRVEDQTKQDTRKKQAAKLSCEPLRPVSDINEVLFLSRCVPTNF